VQVNMTDFYEFALIANVSVGTPAQNFSVKFDLWSSDLSVVDATATFDSADYGCQDSSASNICSTENANIQKKNLYNTSASSTYTATKKKFVGWEDGDTGKQVKDVFTEGSNSTQLTFGDLTQVGLWLEYIPVMDGVQGLSSAKSYKNKGMTNVLGQISSTLASPVVTIHINRSVAEYIAGVRYPHTDAEYLFGSNALPQCNQANWQTISLFKPFALLAIANATGITYDGADANGCNTNTVFNNGKLITPIDSFMPMEVSVQAFEAFRLATNAVFDYKLGWYTTDCNNLGNVPNVNIALSDGNSLSLKPADYVINYKK